MALRLWMLARSAPWLLLGLRLVLPQPTPVSRPA
jgi:hypothetical protein